MSADAAAAAAGGSAAAAAPPPSFVLDPLKHVEPLPGPVWRDRLFAAAVADSHVSNTELAGFDQKRGGDMAALLAVFVFLGEQCRDTKREQLDACGVTEENRRALDKVLQIFQTSISLAKAMAEVQTPAQFAAFLFQFKSAIRNMAPTEKLLIPAGWRSMDGGSSVMLVIERHESDLRSRCTTRAKAWSGIRAVSQRTQRRSIRHHSASAASVQTKCWTMHLRTCCSRCA